MRHAAMLLAPPRLSLVAGLSLGGEAIGAGFLLARHVSSSASASAMRSAIGQRLGRQPAARERQMDGRAGRREFTLGKVVGLLKFVAPLGTW